MRIFLVICASLIFSCSKDYNLDPQSISIKYSKEGISHPSILEGKILSHLQKTDFSMEEELFLNSWISFLGQRAIWEMRCWSKLWSINLLHHLITTGT